MYSFLFLTMLSGSLAAPASIPDGESEEGFASATIWVNLPSDARLYIDGEATESTSSARKFTTPPLNPEKTYVYELEGKVVRNGRTVTKRKVVEFHAGDRIEVSLDLPRPPAPATLVVRLPADALLTIDDEQMRSGGSVREIDSPPLEPGRTYTYTVVGQVVRDGQIRTARRQVDILADHVTEVTLDLPEAPAVGLMGGGSIYNQQGMMGARGFDGGFAGGGVMGGGFAGGGFSGGGMPFTGGGGGNSGSGAQALYYNRQTHQIVPVPLHGPMGGMPYGMPGGGMMHHHHGRP